ncbi:pathogenesis-related protein-like [Chenopodium quinoa]|uniref:pathogenesis-related protein-like n=1 Tax=Chenopodium quinoa TaxID=63459 RepID=UPI000B797DC2|nr:pathogenesis-related protein-like [Chenopodium quinoa]
MSPSLRPLLISCLVIILASAISTPIRAATFTVKNQCGYTVWGAALPGGAKEMPSGDTWNFDVDPSTSAGRVWGRTGCTSSGSNSLKCTTGDCGGGLFDCGTNSGAPPLTIAEYTLTNTQDTIDISLVDGFNVPMSFKAASGCDNTPSCAANVLDSCPSDLKVDGGCLSACNKYNTDEYCCRNQYETNCPPNNYSMIFKNLCPQAYSYAKDDQTSTFVCPHGTNYVVTFCP